MTDISGPKFSDEMPDVVLFPKWNHNVTAAQRLHELALIAEKHPQRFQKLFVGWVGEKDGRDYNNDDSIGMTTTEQAGWLSYWIFDLHRRTSKPLE